MGRIGGKGFKLLEDLPIRDCGKAENHLGSNSQSALPTEAGGVGSPHSAPPIPQP